MRIRTRVSDNARVYLYTSSFPFRSLHSAHSARRYSYPDRIVLQDARNTRLRPPAQLVRRPVISRGETNAESQVFLIAPHGILRRPPFLLSFPKLDPSRESSTLFYARLTLVSSVQTSTPLKFDQNFLIGERVSRLSIDFTLESRNLFSPSREIPCFPSKFHDR